MPLGLVMKLRTIIPSEVITEIDMRLVPESDGKKLMESLEKYNFRLSGYYLVDLLFQQQKNVNYTQNSLVHL